MTLLNRIEDEVEKYKGNWGSGDDVSLWMDSKGKFKRVFSSKETWEIIREKHASCSWSTVVWFKHATPKFSFILWMAMHDRLSTGDRMSFWNGNVDTSCVLCQTLVETKEHLFFECPFASIVWRQLMEKVLENEFTVRWDELIVVCTRAGRPKVQSFIIRYAF